MTPIYLDYAATTPVDPEVAAAMAECLTEDGVFGNPASATHAFGREAAGRVEQARAEVAGLVGAEPSWIVFTSGATEADNLAVFGLARGRAAHGRHVVASTIEHRAVADPVRRLEREGWQVTWLETDRDGLVRPERLREALREDTALVSIIHANNEVGVLQDLPALAALCRERGVPLHSDAAQSVGKVPLAVAAAGVDLLSFTAHKLYGPKGVGALVVCPAARAWLQPQQLGGGHERGLRSGTPATHQIVGFGVAARIAADRLSADAARLRALRDRLWARIERLPGVHRNGHPERCLPGLLSVSFEDVDGESLVAGLEELAVSTGSACSSAVPEPSAVLRALGVPESLAESTLRISLGRGTSAADVEAAGAAIERELARLRAAAP